MNHGHKLQLSAMRYQQQAAPKAAGLNLQLSAMMRYQQAAPKAVALRTAPSRRLTLPITLYESYATQ